MSAGRRARPLPRSTGRRRGLRALEPAPRRVRRRGAARRGRPPARSRFAAWARLWALAVDVPRVRPGRAVGSRARRAVAARRGPRAAPGPPRLDGPTRDSPAPRAARSFREPLGRARARPRAMVSGLVTVRAIADPDFLGAAAENGMAVSTVRSHPADAPRTVGGRSARSTLAAGRPRRGPDRRPARRARSGCGRALAWAGRERAPGERHRLARPRSASAASASRVARSASPRPARLVLTRGPGTSARDAASSRRRTCAWSRAARPRRDDRGRRHGAQARDPHPSTMQLGQRAEPHRRPRDAPDDRRPRPQARSTWSS